MALGSPPLPPFNDHFINRVYHSSALLMPDATVLITGSNPNPYLVPLNPKKSSQSQYPTEFRTQLFLPHYLQYCIPRNVIISVSGGTALGLSETPLLCFNVRVALGNALAVFT